MRAGGKARGDALKQALIDAAERRLADSGLAALNVRQLAADAECGAGTIGYLFGSLDNLILLANDRTLAQIDAALAAALADAASTGMAHKMEALALAYLDYAGAHFHRWEALFLHRLPPGIDVPEWYAARRDALIGRIAAVIAPVVAAPGLAAMARTIFEAVHGVATLGIEQKLGDDFTPLRDRMRGLVRLLAAGLSGNQP